MNNPIWTIQLKLGPPNPSLIKFGPSTSRNSGSYICVVHGFSQGAVKFVNDEIKTRHFGFGGGGFPLGVVLNAGGSHLARATVSNHDCQHSVAIPDVCWSYTGLMTLI